MERGVIVVVVVVGSMIASIIVGTVAVAAEVTSSPTSHGIGGEKGKDANSSQGETERQRSNHHERGSLCCGPDN